MVAPFVAGRGGTGAAGSASATSAGQRCSRGRGRCHCRCRPAADNDRLAPCSTVQAPAALASLPAVMQWDSKARTQPPARLVNGVDGFIGNANAYETVPVWQLGGRRYQILESDLAVASNARPYRTVSVSVPHRPAWSMASVAPSRSVRLASCGRHYALYIGGILVRHPACVTLAVTGPAGKPVEVAVAVLRSCRRRAH